MEKRPRASVLQKCGCSDCLGERDAPVVGRAWRLSGCARTPPKRGGRGVGPARHHQHADARRPGGLGARGTRAVVRRRGAPPKFEFRAGAVGRARASRISRPRAGELAGGQQHVAPDASTGHSRRRAARVRGQPPASAPSTARAAAARATPPTRRSGASPTRGPERREARAAGPRARRLGQAARAAGGGVPSARAEVGGSGVRPPRGSPRPRRACLPPPGPPRTTPMSMSMSESAWSRRVRGRRAPRPRGRRRAFVPGPTPRPAARPARPRPSDPRSAGRPARRARPSPTSGRPSNAERAARRRSKLRARSRSIRHASLAPSAGSGGPRAPPHALSAAPAIPAACAAAASGPGPRWPRPAACRRSRRRTRRGSPPLALRSLPGAVERGGRAVAPGTRADGRGAMRTRGAEALRRAP